MYCMMGAALVWRLSSKAEAQLWCYHALNAFEEGGAERLSTNRTYTFATPANDHDLPSEWSARCY